MDSLTDDQIKVGMDILGLSEDHLDPVARFAKRLADEVLDLRDRLRLITTECQRNDDPPFEVPDDDDAEGQFDYGFHEGWLGALDMICDLAGEALGEA